MVLAGKYMHTLYEYIIIINYTCSHCMNIIIINFADKMQVRTI